MLGSAGRLERELRLQSRDVELEREVIWAGDRFHPTAAIVDRRGPHLRAADAGFAVVVQED